MEQTNTVPLDMGILVIDDIYSHRRVVRGFLNYLGFRNVVEASSGREALEKIRSSAIDLVISDLHLTDMSGIDVLRAIKGQNVTHHLKFIMITSDADIEEMTELRKHECAKLMKPFTAETLYDLIVQMVT